MESKILIIRHGITEGNKKKWFYGATDIGLCEEGVAELIELEEQRNSGFYPDVPEDAKFFTTGMKRTEETLGILFGDVEHGRITDMKEMNFGDWEGQPWAEIIKDEPVDQFFARYIEGVPPGGESLMMQYARVRDFLLEKRREGYKQILVFCHGGVINCARAITGEVRLVDAFATLPGFGSVTRLDFTHLED